MSRRVYVQRHRTTPPSAQVDASGQTPPGSPRIVLAAAAACLAVLGLATWHWWADWHRLWDIALLVFDSPGALHAWIAQFGAWAPLLFFAGVAAQVIVAPIPGSIF